jgi:hypothetical protein
MTDWDELWDDADNIDIISNTLWNATPIIDMPEALSECKPTSIQSKQSTHYKHTQDHDDGG